MEPGERHREHDAHSARARSVSSEPQWSPVNVTGNTGVVDADPGLCWGGRNGAR